MSVVFASLIVFCYLFRSCYGGANCSDPLLKFQCSLQKSCGECIREHQCCNWLYTEEDVDFPRCNVLPELRPGIYGKKIEKNSNSAFEVEQDFSFTEDITSDTELNNITQIRPQIFSVTLRKGIPVNLTFYFKPVRNYPLDLYYLGDLSYSMEAHLKAFKNLGEHLGPYLSNLTKNYRLAYGSFMDKPDMPFYYTDEASYNNPCRNQLTTCEKGYLFKHRQDFTSDIDRFFEKVSESNITANVDDLDGALSAIMQLLVCKQKIKWHPTSRKLIVLPTDSYLHVAGDGVLAGAVRRNIRECMLDDNGDYQQPMKYDYPDVGQIYILLKEFQVNIIVAVKEDKINYYKRLKKDVLKDHVFVSELERDSKNILPVVELGYKSLVEQVQFSVNTSEAEELDVTFFGDCFNTGEFNQTSFCYNAEEGDMKTFKLQLTLKKFTDKRSVTLHVKEKNINEQITIKVNYVGTCDCENYNGNRLNCGEHGKQECGRCQCDLGWTGETCDQTCEHNIDNCRENVSGVLSTTCYGRGECVCDKCICEQSYEGKYCEHVNLCRINKVTRKICSGESHGKCIQGVCVCEPNYSGEDCSCEESTENCKFSGDLICNNKGKCECNSCICDEGFSGRYCEKHSNTNVFCNTYEPFVISYRENGTDTFKKGDVDILIVEQDNACNDDTCTTVYFTETSRCTQTYCYKRTGSSIVLVLEQSSCLMTAGLLTTTVAASIFAAIILGGLIILFCKKYRDHMADVAEYKKYLLADKTATELNPLYKNPVTTFQNPMHQ